MTKKRAYPIIISEEKDGFYVSIPDFDTATQGESIADAIMMARDAIGLVGIDMQDEGKELPAPYSKEYNKQDTDIVTFVDIDFAEYRKIPFEMIAPKDPFYSTENTKSIKESIQQINEGKIVQKTMEELEAMEFE